MIFVPLTDNKSNQIISVNPIFIKGVRQAGFVGSLLVFTYMDGEETEYVSVAEDPDEVLEKIRLYSIEDSKK